MESTPDSDQVTPAVLPVTSMADMEMSSDIDMASEMDLTTGVDFNSTLDVNHLLGIDAVSAATEHTGADLDAEAMFSSVSSTTVLLEDSMGMVDMSCSQGSRASDVQGIVAMKIDNSSCDATPLMSTRSSALSLQDSTSDLFPVDFPSGLGTDDSSTTDMIATKDSGENAATGEEQNNGRKISNNDGNVAVKESQECEAVDMDETNICAGHMSTAKELDGQTLSPVEVSNTSSPLDLTVSNNASNKQNSDFQMSSDCGNKVMASCTEDGGLIDVQIAGDGLKVSPATLTVEHLSTETDPVVPKVALRKRKQMAAVGQRRSTRLKPCITDDPSCTESSPSLVKGGPEEAKCIEGDDVDDVLIQDESAKEGSTKDIPFGDALLETVPTSKESVKGTVGLGPLEDSVVVSSPATTRNVARRGKRRHLGGRPVKARRNAKRQQIVNEDADSETTTEVSPSAPVLDKEQVLTVDGKNSAPALQLQVSMEEDTMQNDGQISKDKDTKTDGDSGQTPVNVEKTEVVDTPDQTCAAVSVASSDTMEYSGVLPDVRQQEFTDEPMAQTSDTISSAANSEQHVVDVGTSGQTLVETTSSIGDTDAVVGSRDRVVGSIGELAGSCEAAVEDGVVSGQAGQITTETESSSGDILLEPKDVAVESIAVEPVISRSEIHDNVAQAMVHSGKEASSETVASSVVTEDRSAEEKGIETNAWTEAVDQETKSTLCPGCSGNCTTPVKLSCSHVVCEQCAPPDGGTATPQACPVCKSGTSADGSGETDPAAVAESDNAEAEEQSGVDAGQDWTGSNETEAGTAELTADPTGAESTEQPAPPGSLADCMSQQANSTGVTPKKTLLATPVLPPTNYDVPPPGTEPAYDGYWSQQQGAHSGYSDWSEQQAPPPGWVPPQGGPPPYGPPPTGPPPRGPGPMIPGPQGPNAPPPNWYSQSYMQGGPGGWGYPPTPQQWQQPYWYGSNYDYYNYYQWYYSYYGQSQQYPSATWPPNEWSVAANSLAAAAAVTSVSTSTSTAVTSTKAEVASKLVVSTVSNRPMSSIPLPIPEPAVSVAVTSWPPTAPSQTVTSWPPPPPVTHQKPAVITAAPKPVHSVARPTRPLAPPQPVMKSATPMPQTMPAAPAVTFAAQTSTLPKTAGDSRVEKQKKQLYIFNLPQDTSLTEVKALVAKYGKVLDCAVADDQGRAGLLAVVTMETIAGATICCTGLRSYRFKGRQLEVRRATTRKSEDSAQPNITEEAESSSGVTSSSEAKLPDTGVTSSDGSAADTQKQASMWVGNLPPGTKAKDVLDLLNPHGKVINCKIGASKGKSDLFAMVVMETSSDISQCISKLHGSEFQGQKLQLKKLKQKSSGTKKAE